MRYKAGRLFLMAVMMFCMGGCLQSGEGKQQATNVPTFQASHQDQSLAKSTIPAVTEANKDRIAASPAEQGSKRMISQNVEKDTGSNGEKLTANQQGQKAQINITGAVIKGEKVITLEELQKMQDIIVSADYFSRGAEKPGWGKTAHTAFTGVLLYELLADHVGLSDTAKQVKIIAEDGYTQVFTIEDIKADYMDETDPDKNLRMIIAWQQDGEKFGAGNGDSFRLVMGQQFAGDYNRQKWVDHITKIVVE